MKTTNATNLLTNKTSIKVIRFWPIYDGQSMMIDSDSNHQSYIQDWESFEAFNFDYEDKTGYHIDGISRDDMTELEYDNLLTLSDICT